MTPTEWIDVGDLIWLLPLVVVIVALLIPARWCCSWNHGRSYRVESVDLRSIQMRCDCCGRRWKKMF
jgi:hypothetical protein